MKSLFILGKRVLFLVVLLLLLAEVAIGGTERIMVLQKGSQCVTFFYDNHGLGRPEQNQRQLGYILGSIKKREDSGIPLKIFVEAPDYYGYSQDLMRTLYRPEFRADAWSDRWNKRSFIFEALPILGAEVAKKGVVSIESIDSRVPFIRVCRRFWDSFAISTKEDVCDVVQGHCEELFRKTCSADLVDVPRDAQPIFRRWQADICRYREQLFSAMRALEEPDAFKCLYASHRTLSRNSAMRENYDKLLELNLLYGIVKKDAARTIAVFVGGSHGDNIIPVLRGLGYNTIFDTGDQAGTMLVDDAATYGAVVKLHSLQEQIILQNIELSILGVFSLHRLLKEPELPLVRALALKGNDKSASVALALFYEKQGQLDSALEFYELARSQGSRTIAPAGIQRIRKVKELQRREELHRREHRARELRIAQLERELKIRELEKRLRELKAGGGK